MLCHELGKNLDQNQFGKMALARNAACEWGHQFKNGPLSPVYIKSARSATEQRHGCVSGVTI